MVVLITYERFKFLAFRYKDLNSKVIEKLVMLLASIIFGAITLISALGVVAARKPLNSALWLIGTLFSVAVHFALLEAHFLAAMQILIYTGAIMVLVIFVIMLLGTNGEIETSISRKTLAISGVLVGLFLSVLLASFGLGDTASRPAPEGFGTIESVGWQLFSSYLFQFEIVSVLLLAAIISATILVREKKRPLPPGRGLSAMRTGELK